MDKLRIGILVSGRGSVLNTVLRTCADGSVPGAVVAVASNKVCPALDLAREASVPHVASYPLSEYESRSSRDAILGAGIRRAGANLVITGGYDEALEPSFFETVSVDVISMYPALLPAFGELPEAIGPALDYGVKTIGVTIHFRTPLTGSGGAIIAQEPLPVDEGDTVDAVMQRVIALESEFLPRVLRAFGEGRIIRNGSRVRMVHRL